MIIAIENKVPAINFAPSALEELIQNVQMILTTTKGTVPLDREFGLESELLDLPINVAQARLTATLSKRIKTLEPRAALKRVEFKGDGELGLIISKVEIEWTR